MSRAIQNEVFIVGTSVFLPNAPVDNANIEAVLGQVGGSPSRARSIVLRNNGIRSRYYAIDPISGEPTHSNSQITAAAVRGLIDDEFSLDDLDCLVTGTSTPDQLMPNHGVMVHGELGGRSCEVVSTAGICLAGLTSLKYAWLSVLSGNAANAVATGSELASSSIHSKNFEGESQAKIDELSKRPEIAFEKDFLRWMLSDGAGAMLLRNSPRVNGLSLRIDWIEIESFANELPVCMYQGATKDDDGVFMGWGRKTQMEWSEKSIFSIKQDVRLLNNNVVEYTLAKPLAGLIEKRALDPNRISWFLPHISSAFFRKPIEEALERIGFPISPERWFTNLDRMGNTGSASFYIMLDELFHSGKLLSGQTLLCFVPESGRFSSGFIHLTVVGNA